MHRRRFLQSSTGAFLSTSLLQAADAVSPPLDLSAAHRTLLRQRKKRIVVQYDANDTLWSYWKLRRHQDAPFGPFRDAVFSGVDQPGNEIDALWWDIGGNPLGCAYPSKIQPPVNHPLLLQWLSHGTDWVAELVSETRRRKLEVFWNHRISEVECLPEGGQSKESHPLKLLHPDWVVPTSWWPQGMWNLAAPGLRDYKIAELRELATRYDLDGIQIDFSRHIPCLPVGHQWELRGHVTQFMRGVRQMLLEVAHLRGRPLLLAAKVPQTLAGCHADGFDIGAWADQHLVDILTLGSRSMDVDVEGLRAVVGQDVQLQPCFDDHHATDGYRSGSLEFLRGVFANHLQRGADSVVTFNWSIGPPEIAQSVGVTGSPTHMAAYQEIGDLRTLRDKDKIFAVERRGGYPWADGFFNRNDTAPLPIQLSAGQDTSAILHLSDAPSPRTAPTLRLIFSQTTVAQNFEIHLNETPHSITVQDTDWKDPQIFSPKPQPISGGNGLYAINPHQQLLRLECAIPHEAWHQGPNQVRISSPSSVQLEKIEAHLHYH